MSGYKHGIYIYEEPTSIVPPVRVDASMPVFFVTAPVHLTENPYDKTNVPKLCFTYSEAVLNFGFSLRPDIFNNYTACEVIYSQFALFGVSPMVIVNVLDPKIHNTKIANEKHNSKGAFSYVLKVEGVLIDSFVIKNKDSTVTYTAPEHYTLAFNQDGYVNIIFNKNIVEFEFSCSYTKLSPEKVDIYDVIGGYNATTGKYSGLELINEIYPRFRMVPGQIVAPMFSSDPSVAAVMETKAGNINGHFRCISINDLPTKTDNSNLLYQDVPLWKNKNNYVSTRQINCYPKVRLGENIFNFSTQLAGLICKTDSDNFGIPYNSPSNKNLKANGICGFDGEEMVFGNEQANYLNGQGIVTAINWINGWVAWGNRTGAYPAITDSKDAFIPIRRMFDWIGNTIVLTYWSKIDYPLTKRTISTIVDSINIWFNGLASREFILGGRIEFIENDNPVTDLLDGIVKFRVKIAPSPPMEEAQFILEYDPSYLKTLFAAQ